MIKADKWLSTFFGREIVQAKVLANDFAQMTELQKQGFIFVEGEISFELNLAKFKEKKTACNVATQQDLTELRMLFASAFPQSRFRPPYFSSEENQHFYRTWISNAVEGKFDHICLIKRAKNGTILGGVTVRLEPNQQAKIGLLAVVAEFQQQGIGSELMNSAINWAKQQNAQMLTIATQTSNLTAMRFYQHLGAKPQATYYWFYPSIST